MLGVSELSCPHRYIQCISYQPAFWFTVRDKIFNWIHSGQLGITGLPVLSVATGSVPSLLESAASGRFLSAASWSPGSSECLEQSAKCFFPPKGHDCVLPLKGHTL